MTSARPLKIDFVSDIVCPWCAIGLSSLETALQRLDGVVQAEVHVQPFQLNPDMAPEGEDIVEHLSHKYGMTAEQVRSNQAAIRQRGVEVGFAFSQEGRSRTSLACSALSSTARAASTSSPTSATLRKSTAWSATFCPSVK